MKISLNWIKELVDITKEEEKTLPNKMTFSGINVESVENKNIDNLVIGQVLTCIPHPSSDHLHLCTIKISEDKIINVVCGASNVKEGLKVIVALPGAVLPGNFEIKTSKIRGEESNGMLCALFELGLEEKTDENYAKGICELDKDAPVGENPIKYLGLDDTIYTLDLNPNRSDCTNHLGFAYEVGSVLGKKVNTIDTTYKPIATSIKNSMKLEVNTEKCKTYVMKEVHNIKVGPSPDFIKHRLESSGIRSINNVVDISNYVMLLYGQPLHFFDKNKLGQKIVVRQAKENEETITLDNITRTLNSEDIVITNGYKTVAIAGVMGCENTQCDENTKDIIIESAIFDSLQVRRTSIRLGLRSESSLRNEKPLNYEYTYEAAEYAASLLEKYASGKVYSDSLTYDNGNKEYKKAIVPHEKINKVLGINVPKEDVNRILDNLGFSYEVINDTYNVVIPNRRCDVSITEDVIEEIGRLYGYDKIEEIMPIMPIKKGEYAPKTKFRKDISKHLRSLLLNETRTYTLVNKENAYMFNDSNTLEVLKPMSNDRKYIKRSILPSLIEVYKYNKSRSIKDINIYEISNIYDDEYNEKLLLGILISGTYLGNEYLGNQINASFSTLKGIIENLLKYLGYTNRYSFLPLDNIKELNPSSSAYIYIDNKVVGYMGQVLPNIIKDSTYVCQIDLSQLYEIKSKTIKFKEPSIYPSIVKDVAFIVNKDINYSDIVSSINSVKSSILSNINIFDLYEGDKIDKNMKSLAFTLSFSSNERTLTLDEVNIEFKKIIERVKNTFNCEIRDK